MTIFRERGVQSFTKYRIVANVVGIKRIKLRVLKFSIYIN